MRWIKFAHGIFQIVLRMNQQTCMKKSKFMNQQKYMEKSKFIIIMKLNKNIQIQLIQLQAHVSVYLIFSVPVASNTWITFSISQVAHMF